MKQLLTLTLLLAAISAISQTRNDYAKMYGIDGKEIAVDTVDKIIRAGRHAIISHNILTAYYPPKSDTLTITDPSIHFIKIGEQVFEVKRLVQLQPMFHFIDPMPKLKGDTAMIPQKGWIYIPQEGWRDTLLQTPNFHQEWNNNTYPNHPTYY